MSTERERLADMPSDLVQRLAKEWVYVVGGEADEAPLAEADARWWLRAIADVIDANYMASVGGVIVASLRAAAEEDPTDVYRREPKGEE